MCSQKSKKRLTTYKVHCAVVTEKEIDTKSSACMKSGFVSSQRGAALSSVALSSVQEYAIRSSWVLIYYIARNRKCFAGVMSSGPQEPEGQGGGESFPLPSYFGRSVTLFGSGHIMPTTLLLTFQTFLRPYELLLAWFVDVAIQFVMLSQYGRG